MSTAMANGGTVLNSLLKVSYLGVPVADIHNTVQISGDSYRISGRMKTNSLVSVVAKSKASFASTGAIVGSRVVPAQQTVNYRTRKKKGAIALSFAGGNLSAASVQPKPKPKPDRVPLSAGHTKSIIDPVSALFVAVKPEDVGNGRRICDRTLPVFDGTNRYNLKLAYKSSSTAKAKGFHGPVFTCSVRYQPIAGHRSSKKNVKFMTANRDMQVTLARVGGSNAYGLFGFRVRTSRGVAAGRAKAFVTN